MLAHARAGVCADIADKGSVIATRMAIDDCLRAECAGMVIEAVVADQQNRAAMALAAIRSWIDRDGVDAATDMGNAAIRALDGTMRSTNHAGIYSGVRHYLTAVAASRSTAPVVDPAHAGDPDR